MYPSAIESVVRRFDDVAEYRATVATSGALRELSVEIELASAVPDGRAMVTKVSRDLREALGMTVPVHIVAAGTLPRFEVKARRFVVE